MKAYAFKLDNGTVYHVIAKSWAQACLVFDNWQIDARLILEMKEC